MGTRFIASHEARAPEMYKKSIAKVGSDQTRITRAYSGKPMRVITNEYVEDMERHPERILPFPEQLYKSQDEGLLILMSGGDEANEENACMPAGQGAGGIHEVLSCKQIVDNVLAEAKERIGELGRLI